MRSIIIDDYDFYQLEIMKYYQPPATWSDEKKKQEARNRIFSGEWLGSRKMDGAFYEFIKSIDGEVFLIGRNVSKSGDYINKVEIVPQIQPFFDLLPNGTVLLGEIYLPMHEGAKNTTSITNCLPEKAVKRQNDSEDMKLHYYVFDCLAWNGNSMMNAAARERFEIVKQLSENEQFNCNNYVEFAVYHRGQELWNELQKILAEGGEGIVIINENSKYEPGKRSTKVSLKIKKELQQSIDCIVIGANPPTYLYTGKEIENWKYWFNKQTNERLEGEYYYDYNHGEPLDPVTKNWFYKWCGSLKLGLYNNENKIIHIGDVSGITDEVRENWRNYIGKVVEIGAMEILDTGGIRHPRVLSWREDKVPKECKIEQLK